MSNSFALANPNWVLWRIVEMISRLDQESRTTSDTARIQQNGVAAILLATILVESFANIFFRVVATKLPEDERTELLDQLAESKKYLSIKDKLARWSKIAFGQSVDLSGPDWQRFRQLQEHRDKIVHFKSSHDTLEIGGGEIQGLSNIDVFEKIEQTTPAQALTAAIGVIALVAKRQSSDTTEQRKFIHHWLGLPT